MNTVEQVTDSATIPPAADEPGKLDILDLLITLVRRRRLILSSTIVGMGLGIAACFVMKPSYTAEAVILPPQQQSSSAALLSSIGGLVGIGGGGAAGSAAAALGLKSPADLYIGILKSRTIADDLIAQFDLRSYYRSKKVAATRKALAAHTDINSGKDGLIDISVTDHDPHKARDIANGYVSELYKMNADLAVGEAAQRRVFFDEQLVEERKALRDAEDDLRATQLKTGVIQPTGQAQVVIQSIAQLRAQIASSEVQAQALRTFATDQNPDLTKIDQQTAAMKTQLAKLENDQQNVVQPGDITLPAGRLPEDTLEYLRKYREVKYHETLFELLSRQYEAAKIDEAKSAPIIQVIDHAVAPDQKSGPHRTLIVAGLGVLFFLMSAAFAIASDAAAKLRRDPVQAAKLDELAAVFRRSRYSSR